MNSKIHTQLPLENLAAPKNRTEKNFLPEKMGKKEGGHKRTNWSMMEGRKFGRLTITGKQPVTNNHIYVMCMCDCGTQKIIDSNKLKTGHTKSCGCLKKETTAANNKKTKSTHCECINHRVSTEYSTYSKMIFRCSNKGNPSYRNRGIAVCDRWKLGQDGLTGFECFLQDMGRRPSTKHSIDRIDNRGSYSPSNCRWATNKEQTNNREVTFYVENDGIKLPLTEWCEHFSINYHTVWTRIKKRGWDAWKAITTPTKRK